MSIFDIFRPAAPAAAPAPVTPPAPGTPPVSGTPVAVPGTPAPEIVPTAPVSPLDAFKEIWQTPPVDPNAPPEPAGLFANLDPNKVMESARRVDFAKAVTPEQLQAIASGGQDAVAAFTAAMNSVAQTVYAQSAVATTKIVEQALSRSQEQYDAKLPDLIRRASVNETLRSENPLLSNPAIQPLVSALSEQFVRKNPTATGTEIRNQVNQYLTALGDTFSTKPAVVAPKVNKAEDWDTFFK